MNSENVVSFGENVVFARVSKRQYYPDSQEHIPLVD